jgi:phage-related protein
MKSITWMGDALEVIRDFPTTARQEAGYGLDNVQHGKEPKDWKPMSTIGPGVKEIRVYDDGQFRVIYIAKFAESIYVLHAFHKKTQQTSKKDIDIAKARLKEVLQRRG